MKKQKRVRLAARLALLGVSLIAWQQAASAQVPDTGMYVRPNNADVTAPIAGKTWNAQTSDGSLYYYGLDGTWQARTLPNFNMAGLGPPTSTDDSSKGYAPGSFYFDTIGQQEYVCSDNTIGMAVWSQFSNITGGSGGVNPGSVHNLTYYPATGSTVSGASLANINGGNIALGASGVQGSLTLNAATSGGITIQPAAVTSKSTIFGLPSSNGTAADLVINQGSGLYETKAMSGDVTINSGGVTTLKTVNSNVGTYLNPQITIDAQGRITSATTTVGGTVTSVGFTGDGTIYNTVVPGSPITTNGAFAPTLADQAAYTLFGNFTASKAAPTFSTGPITISMGGTGLNTTPANGQILIGNTATGLYDLATLTAGSSKLSVTNGNGSITLDVVQGNLSLGSIGGSLSLTSQVTGVLPQANGGIDTTPTNKQILIGQTGGGWTWNTMSGDATISSAGVLALKNTGPGAGSYTSANITIDAQGRVTAAANGGGGAVTSVAMTGDGTLFDTTVSGSPITTSGTLAPALLAQSAFSLFGNFTGSSAAPTFTTAGLPIAMGGTSLTTSPTDGKILIGDTATGKYDLNTLTAGSSKLSITNGNGSITLDVAQGNLSLGSIGGSLNLASQVTGVLPPANGGTGASGVPTTAQLLIGTAGSVYAPQTMSGDITINASGVSAIGSNKVTLGQMAQIADQRVLGNVSGGTANVSVLTPTQLTTLVNVFSSTLSGAVPASGGGTSSFLRADGVFAATPGSGTVSSGLKFQVPVYPANGTFVQGSTDLSINTGVLTIGETSTPVAGSIVLLGGTSGTVTLQVPLVAGTGIVFEFPGANGSSANMLLNQGSNASDWKAMSGDATLASSGAITLKNTGPGAGSYTLANITIDAQGRVTAASNGSAGTGTVTSFSSGNLSPLFTTSVATATSTPALTFALSNAAAHTFLGNTTGSTAAPSYSAITLADLPTISIAGGGTGLTSTPTDGQLLIGKTSGGVYVQSTLTAGSSKLSVTNGGGSITLDVVQANLSLGSLGGSLALTQLAAQADQTVVGNVSGGSASPIALSTTQLTTLVNSATDALSGGIPALGNAKIIVGKTSSAVQAVAVSGDVTLANTGAVTLATVNSNVGSFTNANITVNAKGLITAASNGSAGTGTVTSVDMTVPSWLTVSGNPITTSGTLAVTVTGGLTANQFLATPNGSKGGVSLRSIALADLPTIDPAGGGTGLTATPTDGQLAIGKTSGGVYVLSTLTAGSSKLGITNGAGSITLDVNQANLSLGSIGGSLALTQLAAQADQTVVGNVSGGSAAPIALTTTQLTTLVNTATASLSGAIPALGNTQIIVGKTASAVQAVTMSGDITIGNTGVTAIGANKVTLAQMATLGANTVIGSIAGGTPAALTTTQTTTLINTATDALTGALPALSDAQIVVGKTSSSVQAVSMSGDATIDNAGVLSLKNSGVTPGSYTSADITVDAQGRVTVAANGSGGGSGTVTSFSAGTLSPLFTTSVATATSTPALTFNLSNAAAHTFYGNPTGSTAAPGFNAITVSDLPASIPLTQLATQADKTVVGNVSGGAAAPIALTITQLTTLVNTATDALSGAIPALTNAQIIVGKSSSAVQAVAMSGDATISNTGALTLKNTGPGAGSFTTANITIDNQGRITAASNGSSGSGTVASSTIGQIPIYTAASVVTGDDDFTIALVGFTKTLSLGSTSKHDGGQIIMYDTSAKNTTLKPVNSIGTNNTVILPGGDTTFPTANPSVNGSFINVSTAGVYTYPADIALATGSNAILTVGSIASSDRGSVKLCDASGHAVTVTTPTTASGTTVTLPTVDLTFPAAQAGASGQLVSATTAGVQSYTTDFKYDGVGGIQLGNNGSKGGSVLLRGLTSGDFTLSVNAAAGTSTAMVLPTANGGSADLFLNQGSNATAWKAMSGDATIASSGAITLKNTGPGAGSYTNSNITIDAQGRITAASNGSAGTGTVASSSTGQIPVYTAATTVTGNAQFLYSSGTMQIGDGSTTGGHVELRTSASASNGAAYLNSATTGGNIVLAGNATGGSLGTISMHGSTGSSSPDIIMNGYTSGSLTMKVAAATGTGTIFQFPTGNGSSGDLLINQSAGVYETKTVSGDVTISSSGVTAIGANKVTLAMMAKIADQTILGNVSGGSAVPVALTTTQATTLINTATASLSGAIPALGDAKIIVGKTASSVQAVSMSGDITIDNTGLTAIGANKVTLAQMAKIADQTVLGNVVGSTAVPVALTTTQLTTLVNSATASLSGGIPALGDAKIIVGKTASTVQAVSVSGDITLTNTGATTLATVNSNVGSFTNASITVNAKGLITAASSGAASSSSSLPGTSFTIQPLGIAPPAPAPINLYKEANGYIQSSLFGTGCSAIVGGPDQNLYISGVSASNSRQGLTPLTGIGPSYSLATIWQASTVMLDLCVGSDGNLYGASGATVKRIRQFTGASFGTLANSFTTTTDPVSICAGPDGRVWYGTGTTKIGACTTAGTVTEYNTTTAAYDVFAGPDGNVWYTTQTTKIGKITPAGTVTEYNTTTATYTGCTGPDGNVWYSTNTTKLGKISTTGTSNTEYTTTTSTASGEIVAHSDGRIWYGTNTTKIGSIDTTGFLPVEYTTSVAANNVCSGPDGSIYYTDTSAGSILYQITFTAWAGIEQARLANLYNVRTETLQVGNLSSGVYQQIATAGGTAKITLPAVATTGPTAQPTLNGGLVSVTTAGAQSNINFGSQADTYFNLKSYGIKSSGRQLPTSGTWTGTYWHFGNWTQTSTITLSGNVKVFMNGAPTFLTTANALNAGAVNAGGVHSAAITMYAQNGSGLGAPSYGPVYANSLAAGGGAGGPGGAGGSGGSATANVKNYGGAAYDWHDQLSGSGGMGGNATTAGNGGDGGGGVAGLYFECTGALSCAATGTTDPWRLVGVAGGTAGGVNGGGGGAGSGPAVVIRCGSTVDLGSSTKTINVGGGAGGSATTTAGGSAGGAGGGAIDITAAGTVTHALTAATSAAGGAAGTTGSATTPGTAGSNGVVTINASTTPVSEF